MKIGKLSETILKRSVLTQVHTRREEVLVGAAVGEDCAAIGLAPDEVFVMSVDPITGTTKDIGTLAVHVTVNDLASAGAEPIGIMLSILLPERVREIALKRMMEQIEAECQKLNIQTLGGHTEVTAAVNQPIVTVTGVGKVKKGRMVTTNGARPGMDIVVTKWVGLEGTSIIAKEKEEALRERFNQDFIDSAKNFDELFSVLPESRIAVASGVAAMHDVTEGGIFGALWEMAEGSGVGLTAYLLDIPIKQETVEICNHFDINPYGLISSGSMLMASEDGHELVRRLKEAGINAAVIGKFTDSNDRVIVNKEERRFLEPPKSDELYNV